MAMDHTSILRLVGRFTGLYSGDDLVGAAKASGRCSPGSVGGRRRTPSTYATISAEEKVLYNRSKAYVARDREAFDALFGPYNQLLSELVGHPGFGWPASP